MPSLCAFSISESEDQFSQNCMNITPLKTTGTPYFLYLIYLSICLSIYLCISIYMSVCLSIYLSICLSIYLCISIYMSVCPSIYLSVCLSISVYLSICLSVCPSIYLWLYSPCGPWPLSQFLNLCTVGRAP
jgi:hypothetical protein